MLLHYMVKLSRAFYKRISKIGLEKRWSKHHSKVKINKKFTKEKAAIHAYLCGDGHICPRLDNRGYPHHDIRIYPDDKQLANHIVNLFKKEFNLQPKIKELKNHFRVEIASKPAFFDLVKIGKSDTYSWRIPKKLGKKQLKFWLSAFFDCESNVDLLNKVIALKSVNFNGLLAVSKKLETFNIKSKVYGPYQPKNKEHSKYGILLIKGNNIQIFKRLINFHHSAKREKIKRL